MNEITLSARQEEFVMAALSGEYSELLYGGAMGGGKSVVCVLLCALLCKMYPGSQWVFVRKDLNRMRDTIMRTWDRFSPKPFFTPIDGKYKSYAANGSCVTFMGEQAETDPELRRFRGLEVNGFFFEEGDECLEKTWDIAGMRAGRWIATGGKQPKPLRVCTCNPNIEWPKRRFYDPYKRGALTAPRYYLPAYMTDNPYLDADYLASIEHLPEELKDVMIKGNWDLADIPDQLIKPAWVERAIARGREPLWVPEGRGSLGVDVARYGDDESVIAHSMANALVTMHAFRKYDNGMLAKEVDKYASLYSVGNSFIKVDSIGVGAGVVDFLKHTYKRTVTEFVAGSKEVTAGMTEKRKAQKARYKNFRTETWWELRDLLFKDQFIIGPGVTGTSLLKLTEDLTSIKYSVDSDKYLELEPKDETKKRLGRSPDYGDATMQSLWKPPGATFWAGITAK